MASYLTPASLSNPHHSTSACLSKGSLPRLPASRLPRSAPRSGAEAALGSRLSALRSQYDPHFDGFRTRLWSVVSGP